MRLYFIFENDCICVCKWREYNIKNTTEGEKSVLYIISSEKVNGISSLLFSAVLLLVYIFLSVD